MDGFAEECSSPTHDSNTALEKGTGQGNNFGSVEECNSPTCDFITATDGDSLNHEEINQSRNLNNSETGTTVWNLESIIGENIEIKMSGRSIFQQVWLILWRSFNLHFTISI